MTGFLYIVESNHVFICSGLTAILNAELLPAAVVELSYRILALIIEFDTVASP